MADESYGEAGTDTITSVYLFQVDSAKENRPFFEGMHASSPDSIYFRGLDFKVGPWTPDGVRVDLEMGESPLECSLVLIELESAGSMALKSSRKYLQEKSKDICIEFMRYLNRVIKECDCTADPRETKITLLRDALTQNVPVTVKTAAALRSSTSFLEESPLTDQTSLTRSYETPLLYSPNEGRIGRKQPTFRGVCKLDAEQSKALRRCILILDAIIRKDDHSSAIFHSWLMKAPLKRLLKRMGNKPPTLERFILNQWNSGITIDIEKLLSELVEIWTESNKQIDLEGARKLIDDYFPTAMRIGSRDDQMNLIFEKANVQFASYFF
jgi:hypothetical protein